MVNERLKIEKSKNINYINRIQTLIKSDERLLGLRGGGAE